MLIFTVNLNNNVIASILFQLITAILKVMFAVIFTATNGILSHIKENHNRTNLVLKEYLNIKYEILHALQ